MNNKGIVLGLVNRGLRREMLEGLPKEICGAPRGLINKLRQNGVIKAVEKDHHQCTTWGKGPCYNDFMRYL